MQADQSVADGLVPEDKMALFKAEFEGALKRIDLDDWRKQILAVDELRLEAGLFIESDFFA